MIKNIEKSIKKLCETYKWPMEELDKGTYLIEVEIAENDRSQICSLQKIDTKNGDIIHLQSVIGEFGSLNPIDLESLLDLQDSPIYARFSVVEHEGSNTLVMISRVLLKHTNDDELFELISEIASYADHFENTMFGGDVN